jgi:ABC-type Mn2+/Zn2+ transport system ATPase subunit
MASTIQYKGTRWFKCDLHLHTTASKCFQDRNVTAEQWVARAIEQRLNCVAVTDHNTGEMIDAIKAAAAGKNLTVFPGVEITCDSSKVHLLVLFNIDKGSVEVGDFLVKCNVEREMFGEQNANTIKSIFEVAQIANEVGAIVIPAHIDEYNGLGSASVDILEQFYGDASINAAQVVHKEFLNPELQRTDYAALIAPLNDYYSNPQPAIDEATIKQWHTAVKYAVKNKLAILTFSDNPHEPKNSKHGLAGIGSHFTWIKMDENPTLEGLRQAFLLPEFRVRNEFDCSEIPYEAPALWIKSISITNCSITDAAIPLKVDFSPQLTTIIGGRGSGKSSILRFIRGLFNRLEDLSQLPDILKDHKEFYKITDGRPKKGVLNANTTIEIEFVRNNVLHKFSSCNITNSGNQELKIERFNSTTTLWEEVTDEGYIDFFLLEHYSQKQIYEIAQEPNSLRERIDNSIPDLELLKNSRELTKREFLEKSTGIRTIQQQVTGKGKLQTEIRDLETSINLLQQSGIATLLLSKDKFSNEEKSVTDFSNQILDRENKFDELISAIEITDIDFTNFEQTHSQQLSRFSKLVVDGLKKIKDDLEKLKGDTTKLKTDFDASVSTSSWNADRDTKVSEFEAKKLELQNQGINDIKNYESLTLSKGDKESLLAQIFLLESTLHSELSERSRLQGEYLAKSKEITDLRRTFLTNTLQDGKVKISIKQFRNRTDFITNLRKIIQREDHYQAGIDYLADLCFTGNVEHNIISVRDLFLKIRRGEAVTGVDGHFVNLVTSMNDAQIDEIELLLPEDEIEVQYRTSSSASYKSLSTASAGQKTTAILTFLLSYGAAPLILDQPEDDLDNRLVYDLVVDRLKKAKEHRQIIVVTHNANIPVNGDAEYIISMNSESKTLEVLHTGTVEQHNIKKEICDVMEGSEEAFDMRYKRYKQIN